MITVNNVSMNFSGQTLFKDVELKFVPGNCYGIIGANGAGKSTFLRILSGDLEPTTGEVIIPKEERMSILKQDHFQYDAYTVLDTVMMGNQRLYDVMKEKDALYEKEDFTDEDGVKASELEAEFAEMGGWEAESDVSRLIQGLGLSNDILYSEMSSLTAKEKVKVLLAQALFGKPDIILLDEPTNHLDIQAIEWLEDFLMDCESLILVVSHDRHFLNTVCTNIVDVDYGHIKMYVGNYEFWYESSQMVQRMMKDQNRKNEEKIKELQLFIQRFSANKAKAKQATARRKLLDKLTVEEMPCSTRRYPFVGFQPERELGKDVLTVKDVSVTVDGVTHPVPAPFTVIATENPVGAAGTQMLPQSQLDRFTVCVVMGYPDTEAEMQMLAGRGQRTLLEQVHPVANQADLLAMQKEVAGVFIHELMYRYIVNLAQASRKEPRLALGLSPRASLALAGMARAAAYLAGRDFVAPQDVTTVFADVARHRLMLTDQAKAGGETVDVVIDDLLRTVPRPRPEKADRHGR